MIHMLNQVTNNMLLEHQKRQARSRGNQGYRQSLEKRLKCSVCHWWWDQSHIFLLRQLMVHAKLLQSCLTLCNPMDCSPPGPSVNGILQASILEWVAMPSSRGSSWPRDWIWDSWCSFIKKELFLSRVCSYTHTPSLKPLQVSPALLRCCSCQACAAITDASEGDL